MIKIVLLFPGQGSQYIGMGKSLIKSSPKAKEIFKNASDVLGYDLVALINEEDLDKLTRTEYAQPAIFTYSYSIFKSLYEETKLLPTFLAGHSLGEITALTCAEALSFEDALNVVKERGRLMQEATSEGFGSMAAISGLNPLLVEEECAGLSDGKKRIIVANYNSAAQVVISGEKSMVEKACENLSKLGASAIPLKVSNPFHTNYMEPANQKFKQILAEKKMNMLKWPVISNVDAKPHSGPSGILDKLSIQMVSPVRWKETIDYLLRQGVNTFIELGPKSALSKLVKRDFSHVCAYSYEDNYNEIIATIKEQSDEKRPSLVSRCLAIAVCTRNQNWDEEEYQMGVIEPYRKIQTLSNKIEEEGREETKEEMEQALDMLLSVFKTKRTPEEEQKERFTQIFDETHKRHQFSNFELKF